MRDTCPYMGQTQAIISSISASSSDKLSLLLLLFSLSFLFVFGWQQTFRRFYPPSVSLPWKIDRVQPVSLHSLAHDAILLVDFLIGSGKNVLADSRTRESWWPIIRQDAHRNLNRKTIEKRGKRPRRCSLLCWIAHERPLLPSSKVKSRSRHFPQANVKFFYLWFHFGFLHERFQRSAKSRYFTQWPTKKTFEFVGQ